MLCWRRGRVLAADSAAATSKMASADATGSVRGRPCLNPEPGPTPLDWNMLQALWVVSRRRAKLSENRINPYGSLNIQA